MTDIQSEPIVTQPVVEPTKETTPPVVVEDVNKSTLPDNKDSQRFAALAKREREIQKQAQEVKQKELELNNKYAEIEKHKKEQREHELAKLDPTQRELKVLREELNEEKTARQQFLEEQKRIGEQENKALLDNFYKENIAFIKKNKDKYELINAEDDNVNLVNQKIEQEYIKSLEAGDSRILNVEEAAELVEKELEERLNKYLLTQKLKAKLTPNPSTDEGGEKQEPLDVVDQAKTTTLSNKMSPATQPPKANKRLTEAERLQRAMARYEEMAR